MTAAQQCARRVRSFPGGFSGALAHPRVPCWLIDQAATDPDSWLRANAASNPDLSAPLLAALADDPDSTVRTAAAGNVRLPTALLHRLASTDPSIWVRSAPTRS
ncbi:hypothetical protein [Streptosporangium brasiliense]|uniref:Leucine rich repeat variant n=1 Tax=Streptosporangium brasiliense TaxID=47480 RepID=A0ABT9RHY0_9ACTN|nr:hypothetical protein [Streptosporangium brasiliense]MDP9868889.1 hypothetical protein [Streptosporangium brasiliense]